MRPTLNIQPMIPLSQDWHLITRNIIRLIHAEAPTAAADDEFSQSDIVSTATCPA